MFWRRHPVRDDELSAYIDGELDEARRARVEAHVDGCSPCRETLDELRSVRRALSALPRVDAPRSFALREADLDIAPARTPPALGRAPALLGGLATVAFVAFFVLLGVDLSDGSSTPTGPGTSTAFSEAALGEFNDASERAGQAEGIGGKEDAGVANDDEVAGADGDGAVPMTSGLEPPALPDAAEPESAEPRVQDRLAESDDGPNLRAAEAAAAAVAIVALGSLALVWWRRRVAG